MNEGGDAAMTAALAMSADRVVGQLPLPSRRRHPPCRPAARVPT